MVRRFLGGRLSRYIVRDALCFKNGPEGLCVFNWLGIGLVEAFV